MEPRAYRPLYREYLTISEVLLEQNVYEMTEEEFVGRCMMKSRGFMNPDRSRVVYKALMEEAGL